jgi:hypothetical protein
LSLLTWIIILIAGLSTLLAYLRISGLWIPQKRLHGELAATTNLASCVFMRDGSTKLAILERKELQANPYAGGRTAAAEMRLYGYRLLMYASANVHCWTRPERVVWKRGRFNLLTRRNLYAIAYDSNRARLWLLSVEIPFSGVSEKAVMSLYEFDPSQESGEGFPKVDWQGCRLTHPKPFEPPTSTFMRELEDKEGGRYVGASLTSHKGDVIPELLVDTGTRLRFRFSPDKKQWTEEKAPGPSP